MGKHNDFFDATSFYGGRNELAPKKTGLASTSHGLGCTPTKTIVT